MVYLHIYDLTVPKNTGISSIRYTGTVLKPYTRYVSVRLYRCAALIFGVPKILICG